MNRIRLYAILLFLLASSLVGCNSSDNSKKNNIEYEIFEAEVIDNEGGLLVSPDEESVEYTSSDKIMVELLDAEILDEKGNTVDSDKLKPGDRLRIYYNGMILESYPAQITANKIEVIGHNHIVDGIFAVIDDIYKDDNALNHDITMIAFDTTGWISLTKAETYAILSMAYNKYGFDIIQGTFDELAEQGLIDEDNLYFENGILIELKDIEINKGRDKIECSIQKWRSGLGAIGWDGNAKLNGDEWEITKDMRWIS